MTTKMWMIIKDDSRKTFEVCGQETNENSFTNKTYAMQRAGMNVSCMTPPITNKSSSRDLVRIVGYTREDGLYDRLLKQHRDLILKQSQEWD